MGSGCDAAREPLGASRGSQPDVRAAKPGLAPSGSSSRTSPVNVEDNLKGFVALSGDGEGAFSIV